MTRRPSRPGAARDCVRVALLEVGADVVAEEDPVSADPESVRATSPQVLMIVLDAASEDATGQPAAIASSGGRPNPSKSEGKTMSRAV